MIEKLDFGNVAQGEVDAAESILSKLNEVIDNLNDLLLTHPKVKEHAEMRRQFEKQVNTDTPTGQHPNND